MEPKLALPPSILPYGHGRVAGLHGREDAFGPQHLVDLYRVIGLVHVGDQQGALFEEQHEGGETLLKPSGPRRVLRFEGLKEPRRLRFFPAGR